jgi:small-conductance mechanosensitive channel
MSCGSTQEQYTSEQKIGEMKQSDFNIAIDRAVRQLRLRESRLTPMMAVSMIIYLILIVWAVMLAMTVKSGDKALHIVTAFVFSPAYILAYYLGMMK